MMTTVVACSSGEAPIGRVAFALAIIALHLSSQVFAATPQVCLQFNADTNTIVLGTPLQGELSITTLVGRSTDFGNVTCIPTVRRAKNRTSSGMWETGFVRCTWTQIPDSRSGRSVLVSSEEGEYGAPSRFPGLIWFQAYEDVRNFNAGASLLFPSSGVYEIAFRLGGGSTTPTEIHVLPPAGRDAAAWEALPLKVYCGIFSPCWYKWENRSALVDPRAVEIFMRTYGDSCYGDWLMRWAKYYRDNPYGKKNTPSWMSNAWNVVNERYPPEKTALDVLREWDESMVASPPPGIDAVTRAREGVRPAITGAATSRLAATNAHVTGAVERLTDRDMSGGKREDSAPVVASKPDTATSRLRLFVWGASVAGLAIAALALLLRARHRE